MGSLCDILIERTRLEQVSELKYWEHVLDELGKDVAEYRRKVMGFRRMS